MAVKQAKVITVTSVKGGTGKSTFTLNLAGILSSKKIKTLIVDMDLHAGSIGASLNLNLDNDFYTLISDIINHQFKSLDDYIKSYDDYIDVLQAPKDPRNVAKIDMLYIDMVLKKLKYQYDVILIDTNHIIDKINLITFDHSDNIIYLLNHDLMGLKNMKTMLAIYEDMGLKKYTLVLNDALSNSNIQCDDIADYLGERLYYVIPKSFYVKNIQSYIMKGKIVTLDKRFKKEKGYLVLEKIIDDILK